MTPVKLSTLGPATDVSAGQSDNAISAFNHACAVEVTSPGPVLGFEHLR